MTTGGSTTGIHAVGHMGMGFRSDVSGLLAAAGIAARPERLASGTLVFAPE